MARIKVAVHAHKKRRKIMKLAKGYFGSKSKQYRAAKEQVARSLRYAYIGRSCASATSVPCGSPASTRLPASTACPTPSSSAA